MEELLDDPTVMTPAQRRQEIAAILARGMLRLRQTAPISPGSQTARTAGKDSESLGNGLDEGAKTCPHALVR